MGATKRWSRFLSSGSGERLIRRYRFICRRRRRQRRKFALHQNGSSHWTPGTERRDRNRHRNTHTAQPSAFHCGIILIRAGMSLACVLVVFFSLKKCFLCICVLVLYLLVVRAASVDGCLCLSGSLPLLSCMLVLIVFCGE